MKVAHLCPTLCNPMDCSLPGSSVHGILQARILEWTAIPFYRGCSQPTDQIQVSRIADGFFTISANREALEHWSGLCRVVSCREVTQSCPTLCDPMDCSLPGSSLHGILQARVLEWVSISFSRESSQPKDQTWVSCIPGRCFNLWATRVAYPFSRESSPPRNWTRVSCIAGWFFISWANLHTDI